MAYDSMANASIPMAASNAKDVAKKKKANRSAKLKQCKLDARREQWLSQVKNKESKQELNGVGVIRAPSMHVHNERDRSLENLEINPIREENGRLMHHYADSEWPSNSPSSHTSSVLGTNESGTNFTGSSNSSSSSISSGGSCSGNISEEDEEGDDGCLDDWEAVADALAATDDKQEQHNPNSESHHGHDNVTQLDSLPELIHTPSLVVDVSKPESECVGNVQRAWVNCRAWSANDAFRPHSLPNLSKQHSCPMNSDRGGGPSWGRKNAIPAPSSCPICCEDLDFTDSSFLPCLCGFRLCLFCHKRILEDDGRCPGCRKQYDYRVVEGEAITDGGNMTFRMARSCSMITRS